ncbi:MAG: bacillithiol biosynthesis deacetylase BshB1 [Sphingobacteriaceae bacterium]|nr:bacillithiol biosynthesis deacetylase BshB1 [Cytophagaceae bacterium]
MKLSLLVLAAHPDDAEMSCGGTIAVEVAAGRLVGVVDFTQGELGTRGTPAIRLQEAEAAAQILSLSARHNLGFRDGFFKNDEEHQLRLVPYLRRYRPDLVIANAIDDRHPDHGRAAALAVDACFLSGLRQLHTLDPIDGTPQEAWRPRQLFHYIQDRYIQPHVTVDISAYWQTKLASIQAYRSQFFDPTSSEPESYLTSPEFMEFLKARWQESGHAIGVQYGEGFTSYRKLGSASLFNLK